MNSLRHFLCIAASILCAVPLHAIAKDVPGRNPQKPTPQEVLRFIPAGKNSGPADSTQEIKTVVMPPNRIVIELNNTTTTDGSLDISSARPLCLGNVEGCKATVERVSDHLWNVKVTNRTAGGKQLIELANCRSANDAVTPTLFKRNRHEEFLKRKAQGPIDLLFLGDSITDWWPKNGNATWGQFAPHNPANFGIAAMRTEGLLWNLTNGELEGIKPKAVVILIGVNNMLQCPDEKPEWIAAGVRKIVETVRQKLPDGNILLLGIFPARNPAKHPVRTRIAEVNRLLPALADGKKVRFLNIGNLFLDPDGSIRKDLMPDGVHPNAKGYQVWYEAMKPALDPMLE